VNANNETIKQQITALLEGSRILLKDILPSVWSEEHRYMTTNVSPFPGRFSFRRTPYLREICNTVSASHDAHTVAVMKGAQIGFSTGVIENAIGYIISEQPGNILFLTGHADLAEEAVSMKIDQMIDSCGLRPLIRPNVLRTRNQRSGDTSKSKEFPGGSLVAGYAGNHKLLRQRSVRYGFIDDFDAAKGNTKESGSTTQMIEQRFAAYGDKKKLYYISTPEVKRTSNIEPVYLLGDQRKYHVPCPCCGDYIILEWAIQVDNDICGVYFERDERGELVEGSVGYKCQSCKEVFNDKHKDEMLNAGEWRPTAKPSQPGYYSYHLSALYAPPGMYDWEFYARQYCEANPINAPQDVRKMQTFVNLVLGETFEEMAEAPKATLLQRNVRDYDIDVVPERMSISDGNGQIVLLTCACDLNGKLDDARLDYEIVAWAESGASYSVRHGSIGTFKANQTQRQKDRDDRQKFTYMINERGNVWDKFREVINTVFTTDTGRRMKIMVTGVDTGNTFGGNAYAFVEKASQTNFVVGLKGKDSDKYRRFTIDSPTYKKSRERSDLFLVEANQIKDNLADYMKLSWHPNSDIEQPPNFMNFPMPASGLYTYNNYFSHYESEHRVVDKNKDGDGISSRWVKKNSAVQNHLFDCRVYNLCLKDIMVGLIAAELKRKNFLWNDYVDVVLGRE
jgi:phage terminase large subunit GpA-like protein